MTSRDDYTFTGNASLSIGDTSSLAIIGNAGVTIRRGAFGEESSARFTGQIHLLGQTTAATEVALQSTNEGFVLFTNLDFNLGGFAATGTVYLNYLRNAERFTLTTQAPAGVAKLGDGNLRVAIPVLGEASLTGALTIERNASGVWSFSSDLTGTARLDVRYGDVGVSASFSLRFVAGNDLHFAATFNGTVTLLGTTSNVSGESILTASQSAFSFTAHAAATFGGVHLRGSYAFEIGSGYIRATASGVTFDLPNLSNSRISVTVDTRGTFAAHGDIDIDVGDSRYARLLGTLSFSANQWGAGATFYYTAFVAGIVVGSAPYGLFVNIGPGGLSFNLAQKGDFFNINLFDFRVFVERLEFSLSSAGLYLAVGGFTTYHNTGGGSLHGFIDLRHGGLSYEFKGRFGVGGSAAGASVSGSLEILMRSAHSWEAHQVIRTPSLRDFGVIIQGRATANASYLGQSLLNVSADLDFSRWQLVFRFHLIVGHTIYIRL
jgi:hypothetical protein